MRRDFVALALLAAGACAPVVTHGPRVEPGLHAGLTVGLPLDSDTATALAVLIPRWSAYGRFGVTGKPGGVAASLGLAYAPAENGSLEGDLYLQGPARVPRLAYGAGLMGSAVYAMPYVQLGWVREDGSGLYSTQGVVQRGYGRKYLFLNDPGMGRTEVRPRYWAPAVGYRWSGRAGKRSVYLSGALGSYDERRSDWQTGEVSVQRRRLRALSITGTVELEAGAILKELGAVTRRPIPLPTQTSP